MGRNDPQVINKFRKVSTPVVFTMGERPENPAGGATAAPELSQRDRPRHGGGWALMAPVNLLTLRLCPGGLGKESGGGSGWVIGAGASP